ncbi:MAG TPA: hypothetical protein ENI23_07745 [bacterium]|nr:hypothetical protein [bacterium]
MFYLLHGDNYFESKEALDELINDLQKKKEDLEIEIIHGDIANNLDEFFSTSDAFSLFNSSRLLVIKRSFSNKKTSILGEVVEYLNEKKDLDIVFWEDRSADKRLKLYKFLSKKGVVREFQNKKPAALRTWVIEQFGAEKIKISSNHADAIIFRVGDDQMLLHKEISKIISLLKIDKRSEFAEEYLEMFSQSAEASIWNFIDALTERRHKDALSDIDRLVRDKADYSKNIGMIVRQLRLLTQVRSVLDTGSGDGIRSLGLHPFVLGKIKNQVEGFDLEKLSTLYRRLVNLDLSVKQGRIDEKLGLSLYVLAF